MAYLFIHYYMIGFAVNLNVQTIHSMKHLTILILIISLNILPGQSTVEVNYFFSEALNVQCGYTIQLPEGYDESDEHYPVLYFLHGFGANHTLFYGGIHTAFDTLSNLGQLDHVIIVRPDGSASPYLGSFYTSSELYGDFEEYIIYDLIGHIDETYRTIDHRLYRGISGHSMGGYGSMKLGIKHYDKFGSISSQSGALVFDNLTDLIPDLMNETWWGVFSPLNGPVSLFMFGASGAFSPNLNSIPWYVDLPVDYNGELIDSVYARWIEHDPIRNALDSINVLQLMDYYIDCGDTDDYYFDVHAEDFHEFLDNLNIDHEYYIYAGDHLSQIDSRFPYTLLHHNDSWGVPSYVLGDLIGNGTVTHLDAMSQIQTIMNNAFLDVFSSYSGDLDFNDKIDLLDLLLIYDVIDQ